jgi:hypothetical protein
MFICPDPPRQSIFFNVFNFVLLGQLTFNYLKMYLLNNQLCIQLFQLGLSTSKAEKSNTSAKGCCMGIVIWKFINLLCDSQQPFALVFDFSALLVDNLYWNSCILCLCKHLYAICTPGTELVHRTCRLWSSFSIVRIQNKSLHREICAI